MATGTILQAFKEGSSRPYQNPVKVTVVALGQEYQYKSKNGGFMKGQAVAVSDGSDLDKINVYDEGKLRYFKVNQTIVIRDKIKRLEDSHRLMVVTKASKVFLSTPLKVPEHHHKEGLLLVNPPPSAVVKIKDALSSPAKKKVSVTAKIVQEEEPKTVNVKGENVTIKAITLEDESGKGKVTLWRELSTADVRPGDFIKLTDVVINIYNNTTTLQTTTRSTIKKCEASLTEEMIIMEGISVTENVADIFSEDGRIFNVSVELLHTALETDGCLDVLESSTQSGPVSLKLSCKGAEVLAVEKMTQAD